MIFSLEAMTTATLSKALEAASLRQQAIAANVANANTEGYSPLKLSFETQLEEASASLRQRGSVAPEDLGALRLELEPDLQPDGTPRAIELDAEVAAMARNAVQYQALAQGLSRHFALLAAAAADGRK